MFRTLELSWLRRRLFPTTAAAKKASSRRRTRCRTTQPMLEDLESRIVLATQTFNPGTTAALINDLQAASNTPRDSTIINLQANTTYTLTAVNNNWYGPTGLPPIDSNVTIHGNGATIARDTNSNDNTPDFRLFYVSGGMELPAGELMMDNVTLEGGVAAGGSSDQGGGGLGAGGAIFNQGTLILTAVTLEENRAVGGSSGNTSAGAGGGGMGADLSPDTGDGGGLGGDFPVGAYGGKGDTNGEDFGGGGGGGFLAGANGSDPNLLAAGSGGGKGGFGGAGGLQDGSGFLRRSGTAGDGGGGGGGTSNGDGGDFGGGGQGSGGGGGIGGGGGSFSSVNSNVDNAGGGGGFGGGGGAGQTPMLITEQGLTFDGSNAVALPNGLINGAKSLTVDVTFQTTAGGVILGYQDVPLNTTTINHVPALYVGTNGLLYSEIWNGSIAPIQSTGKVNDGQTHEAVLTLSGNTETLTLDGTVVGTLSGPVQPLNMVFDQLGNGDTFLWPGAPGGFDPFIGMLNKVLISTGVSNSGGIGGFGGGGGTNASGGFGGGDGNGTVGGGGAGLGGAIFNMGADSADPNSGQASLVNCTLTDNSAEGGNGAQGGSGYGGALFNLDGHVTLTNDTLAANTVTGGASIGTVQPDGVNMDGQTGTDITGSPAANGSSSDADGGTVYNLAYGNDIDTGAAVNAILTLNNNILAATTGGNDLVSTSAPTGFPFDAAAVAGHDNLVMTTGSNTSTDANVITRTDDPNLGPLQINNGGLTPTMVPGAGSLALRAGDPSLAPTTDQNGNPRPPNGPIDLGSVQVTIVKIKPVNNGATKKPASPLGGTAGSTGQLAADIAQLVSNLSAHDSNAVNATLALINKDILQLQTSASTASAADRLQIDSALFSAGVLLILDSLNGSASLSVVVGLNMILKGIATSEQAAVDSAQTVVSSAVSAPASWNVVLNSTAHHNSDSLIS